MKNISNSLWAAGVALIVGIVCGIFFFGVSPQDTSLQQNTQRWTCSMHPEVQQFAPGQCALCGMDLISAGTTPNHMGGLSAGALELAGVRTAILDRRLAVKTVEMYGKVTVNEANVFAQSSHMAGRIEDLTIHYEGQQVALGEVIAYVYAPELVVAQQELLQARATRQVPTLYEAAQQKLRGWKLSEQQIHAIETEGVRMRFPILSGGSGVVRNQRVRRGDYVQKGDFLFGLVDLSTVWISFTVSEKDLVWLQEGAVVDYFSHALPGHRWQGIIDFIAPIIQPKSHTVIVRVTHRNSDNLLIPNMLVEGRVHNVLNYKADEWVVPKEAVLWTGKHSVVYVKEAAGFVMRVVTLGAYLDAGYLVTRGLMAGDEIVVSGAFVVDASATLQAQPSMVNRK